MKEGIMHFTTGAVVLLFLSGFWQLPRGWGFRGPVQEVRKARWSSLESLNKTTGLEAKALEAVEANKAVEEIKREQKAKALALNSEKCESVIRSCAVV